MMIGFIICLVVKDLNRIVRGKYIEFYVLFPHKWKMNV